MEEIDPDREFVRELTLHQGSVLAYIRSLMGGCSGAQDVLQQTNLKLWEKKTDFVPGTNFKAWAFAVARFEVLGQRKRLKRGGWLVFSEEVAELLATDLADDQTDWDDALHALEACVRKLRPHDIELVQVRYASGSGLDEYANRLRRSSGTLKARLFKIRAVLRRCVEDSILTNNPDTLSRKEITL